METLYKKCRDALSWPFTSSAGGPGDVEMSRLLETDDRINSRAHSFSGSANSTASMRHSNNNPPSFSQQNFPAYELILTPQRVISTLAFLTWVFIAIGVGFASEDVQIVDGYETDCIPEQYRSDKVSYMQSSGNKTCYRTLKVSKRMKKPICVYYQLENFFQNHLRYVKSRSDQQLKDPKYENEVDACKPEDKTNGKPIVPCGLIAWSLFNDTYKFLRNEQQLAVNKRGIAWKSDRENNFGKNVFPKNFQNSTLKGGASLNASIPLSEQEDLIVWMKTAALPTFKKLYGKIEVDLEPDDVIQVILENNYNTYSFNGKKKLVLSTTSWIGGRDVLDNLCFIFAGLCFFLAVALTAVQFCVKPRILGDASYLHWTLIEDET